MQLRDYQIELVDNINRGWEEGDRRILAQLPTGGGKTQCFSAIAKQELSDGGSVLVIAHRKELITQAAAKLEAVSGLPCGIIKAGFPANPIYPIQVASIQSLIRRSLPPATMVIIDECHHAIAKSYTDVVKKYESAKILGMTATPCRSDGHGFKDLFDRLVIGRQPSWLIERGYLSKFKLFKSAKISTKGVRKSGGDYNTSQLTEAARKITGDIVEAYQKFADRKSNLVFAVSVEHSQEIVAAFLNAGIPAEHVDGETPDDERDRIFDRFRNKQTLVLSNVGVATEGTDVPGIECVQIARPTVSLILHLQMLGRGLRPSSGKEHCIFIDHTDNWFNHGLPDEDREWSLDPVSLQKFRFTQCCGSCGHVFMPLSHEQKVFRQIVKDDGAIADIKRAECPNCKEIVEWEAGVNPTEEKIGIQLEVESGEMDEVDLTLTPEHKNLIDRICELRDRKGYKPQWAYFHLLDTYPIECDRFTLGDCRYLFAQTNMKRGDLDKFKEIAAANAEVPDLGQPTIGFNDEVERWLRIANEKGYKVGWVFYRLTERLQFVPTGADWLYLADRLGFDKQWAFKQLRSFQLAEKAS